MTTPSTNSFETFTPDDLVAAVLLIDTACNGGAFRGWENIQKAFTIRNRLLVFAEQWKSAVDANPQAEPFVSDADATKTKDEPTT